MSEPLRLEQVYEALTDWNRRYQSQAETIANLQYLLQEASQARQRATDQLEGAMGLPHRLGATLQDVIDEAVRTFEAKLSDERQQLALHQTRIAQLSARIATLEGDQADAISRLVDGMELPAHPNRTLGNAVVDAVQMVQEAKAMVRENL